ncbi:hypothetical protein DVH24_024320 [Malus domestica]|uniref:Uncharacterized protein n=1 Tax=Malus domestica TaxID=3750 RepID=A0A498JHR9_MALDO|nr:hypothetical protein DVH24_024320 [Malus domestica]
MVRESCCWRCLLENGLQIKCSKNLHKFVRIALPELVEEICDPVLLQVNESSTHTTEHVIYFLSVSTVNGKNSFKESRAEI